MNINMKVYLLVLATCASVLATHVEYFKTLDDNLDIEGVFRSPEWVMWFQDCFLERHECDPLTASYKAMTKELFENGCARCNVPQKRMVYAYLKNLRDLYPEEFQALLDMYDPDGDFFDVLLDKIEGY